MTGWQSITDAKEKRAAYMASREWWVKRQAVAERCRGFCERCRINPLDHVHHLTYIRLYAEELDDLQGICQACHDFTHARSDFDPAASERSILKRRLDDPSLPHKEAREIIRTLTTGGR